uniref:BRCT domain-containing protein n=1 Tax=Steinernema glaseri TaxID=37863 RepID=A0A1I7YIQ1_9BILA
MSTQRRSKRGRREVSEHEISDGEVAVKKTRENESHDTALLLRELEELKKSHEALEKRVKQLEADRSNRASTIPPESASRSESVLVTPAKKRNSPVPGPSNIATTPSVRTPKTRKPANEEATPRGTRAAARRLSQNDITATPKSAPRRTRASLRRTQELPESDDEESLASARKSGRFARSAAQKKTLKEADQEESAEDDRMTGSDYADSGSDTEPTSESDDHVTRKKRDSVQVDPNRRRSARNQLAVFLQNASEDAPNLHRLVASFGGTVTEDVAQATHYVADRIEDSAEFACAIALHIPMLNSSWLTDGNAALSKAAYNQFMLRDDDGEERLGINMETLMEKAVFPFADATFTADQKREEVRKIAECCQARFVDTVADMTSGFYVTDKTSPPQSKKIRCVDYETFYRAVCRQNVKTITNRK